MLILIIMAIIGVISLITLILVLLYINWEKKKRGYIESTERRVLVNKTGADVNSGHLGSGSLFNGYGEQSMGTICISENMIPQYNNSCVKNVLLIHKSTGKKYSLQCGEKFYIGRTFQKTGASNSVTLNYPSISSLHCVMLCSSGKVYVEDRKSTNGTYINGRRVSMAQPLNNNDILKLGNEEFLVVL